MSLKNLEGQTAHWIQHLQEYNFTSEHRQDRKSNSATFFHDNAKRSVPTATAKWDPAALRTEMIDQGIGSILEEVETGHLSEQKDIADCATGNPPTDNQK
jgi:hypothetical protein